MIKRFVVGSFANLISIVVLMIVVFIRSALAVRYLSATEAGIWFLLLNIIAVVSFCDFGLSPTLSREIGFAFKKKDSSFRISNLFFTVRKLVNFISLIAVFILFCFGYFYLSKLTIDANLVRKVLYSFVIFSVGIITQFQANPYLAVIYGVGDVTAERYIRAICPLVGVAVSILLVMKLRYDLYGLVAGYLLQTFLIYMLSRFYLHKKSILFKSGRYLKVIGLRILEPSLQWATMNIGAILIFQVSNFIIAYFMGVKYISQFAVLFQIFICIMTLAGITGYVIVPFVAQAKGKNDIEKIHYYFSLSMRSSTSIIIVLAIFFYFFIDPISQIWLGSDFVINKSALLILLVTAIFEVHHVSCAVIAMATGYVKFAAIAIVAGFLNLILSFVLINCWGLVGAVLSIFISQILTNNWYVIMVSLKVLRVPLKKYLCSVFFRLMPFFLYMLVVNIYISCFVSFMTNVYMKLFVAVLSEIIAAFIGGLVFLLTLEERSLFKSKVTIGGCG